MKKLVATLILFAGAAFGQTAAQCLQGGVWVPCSTVATVQEAQSVNAKVSAGSGTTITQAFGSNTTAGNTILCLGFESAAAIPTVTDGQSNTYNVVSSSATAPGYTIAIATNIVGGTTDTITLTTTSGAAAFACHELKGTVTVGAVWDLVNAQQGTATSIPFTSTATTQPNEMVFVGVGMGGGTVNATPALGAPISALTVVDANNTSVTGGAALSDFYAAHTTLPMSTTFTQSVSLSASETYSGVIVSVAPATQASSVVGSTDPCARGPKVYTPINQAAAGPTTLVAGLSGHNTYVCGVLMVAAAAVNVNLVEGTGSNCSSVSAGMLGGTTAATGPNLAANGGFVMGNGMGSVAATATKADNLCYIASGTTQVSGVLITVQY